MMLSVTSFYKNSPRSKKIFRNNNNTTASIKCCGGSFITISRSIFCRYSQKWLANILILLNEICIRLTYHIPMREIRLKCFDSMNHLRTIQYLWYQTILQFFCEFRWVAYFTIMLFNVFKRYSKCFRNAKVGKYYRYKCDDWK